MPFDEEDMKTLNLKLGTLAAASMMLMLSACIISPNVDDDEPGYCPEENRELPPRDPWHQRGRLLGPPDVASWR